MNEKSSLYEKSYGSWSGNQAGSKPDYTKCCKVVSGGPRSYSTAQCANGRGHGTDGAYCKIHDPSSVALRQAASERIYRIKLHNASVGSMQEAIDALILIENGHNDPRSLACEVMSKFRSKDWWMDKL